MDDLNVPFAGGVGNQEQVISRSPVAMREPSTSGCPGGPMRAGSVVILLVLLLCPSPARGQFGELAPDAALYWHLDGVRAEAAAVFAMDPSHLAGRLPRGFQVFTLGGRAARGDTTAHAILAARPELTDYVITVLAVARLDSMRVEGVATAGRESLLAFWWVPVQLIDTTSALPDPRAKRGEQMVELAFWSAEEQFARRLQAVMPSTAAAPVNMEWRAGDSTWRIRLVLPDATIVADCRLRDPAVASDYPLPQYSTVWSGDSVPGPFVVYTYYGHLSQWCSGAWRATGNGALARAIQTGVMLWTHNQTGWRARAAAYAPR